MNYIFTSPVLAAVAALTTLACLVAEKVAATIGFCNTGVAAKSLKTYQNAKVPLIVPYATGTPLTAK